MAPGWLSICLLGPDSDRPPRRRLGRDPRGRRVSRRKADMSSPGDRSSSQPNELTEANWL